MFTEHAITERTVLIAQVTEHSYWRHNLVTTELLKGLAAQHTTDWKHQLVNIYLLNM
jgi:hypothetical protein